MNNLKGYFTSQISDMSNYNADIPKDLEQNLINAQKDVDKFTQQLDDANYRYTDFKKKAQDCKEKRKGKSTGIGKNRVCHIDNLTHYYKQWDYYSGLRNHLSDELASAKDRVVGAKKSIDDWVAAREAAMKTDPDFNLAMQKQQSQQELAKRQQEADIMFNQQKQASEAKTKKTQRTILIVVVVLIIAIGGYMGYKKYKK